MLGPPFNFRRNAQRRYFFLEHSDDACNIFLSLFARRIQLMGYIEICFRIQVFERQILKLPFKCADAQPICQRSIDLEGFLRLFPLFFRSFIAQRAHIVQAVRKLYKDDPNIRRHGKKHLSHAFRLGVLFRLKIEFLQFGDAIYDLCNFRAEFRLDIFNAKSRIFWNIVQHGGANADIIKAKLCQNARHLIGMHDIGLARIAQLPFVRLFRNSKRFLDERISCIDRIILDKSLV